MQHLHIGVNGIIHSTCGHKTAVVLCLIKPFSDKSLSFEKSKVAEAPFLFLVRHVSTASAIDKPHISANDFCWRTVPTPGSSDSMILETADLRRSPTRINHRHPSMNMVLGVILHI